MESGTLQEISLNAIVLRDTSRASTNICNGTPCENSVVYDFQLWANITNSFIFADRKGPGTAPSKVQLLDS